PLADRTPPDPITTAVEAALTALADAAHHGLRRLPRPAADRLREAADRLTRTGLTTSSHLVRTLLHALDHDHQDTGGHHEDHAPHPGQGRGPSSGHTTPHAATTAWTDACIRLHTTAELSHRHD
ncbi:hypothetical protein PV379_30880, partial [Streptomyces caniscabiei]